jgi:hypothetical protein
VISETSAGQNTRSGTIDENPNPRLVDEKRGMKKGDITD